MIKTTTKDLNEQKTISIKFKTLSSDLKLAIQSNKIYSLPLQTTNSQLNSLINKILETKNSIEFKFFLEGNCVETNLIDCFENQNISFEKIFEIFYSKKIQIGNGFKIKTDDWVNSLKISKNKNIYYGHFNGYLGVYSNNFSTKIKAHNSSIISIELIETKNHFENENEYILTSSKNCKLKLWSFSNKLKEFNLIDEIITNDPALILALTKRCLLTKNNGFSALEISQTFDKIITKEDIKIKGNGHSDKISSIVCPFDYLIITGSWDRHFIVTDLTKQTSLLNINTNSVITSLSAYKNNKNILISSHCGGEIKIWDLREGKNIAVKMTKSWQSDVNFTKSENNFISCGHDGIIKFWDIRSKSPITDFKGEGKIFRCDSYYNNNEKNFNNNEFEFMACGGEKGVYVYKTQ